jgi:uroporphyrinogen-III synthase
VDGALSSPSTGTDHLAGKRVVVTRAVDQAADLCERLERLGAEVVRCPTIRTAPPSSFDEMDRALSDIGSYGWVVFTSVNGVSSARDRLAQLGLGPAHLSTTPVAVVGPSTRRVLEDWGVGVAFVPDEYHADRLAETLAPVSGESVLLLRADIGKSTVAQVLEGRGARVDDVVAYRTLTVPPKESALVELRKGVHAVTFTSPSTVRGFAEAGPGWRDLVDGVIIATIGPSTSAAAREAGLEVHIEAVEHTTQGLVTALVRFAEEAWK